MRVNLRLKKATLYALIPLMVGLGAFGLYRLSHPGKILDQKAVVSASPSPSLAPREGYQLRINKLTIDIPIVLDVPGTNEKAYLKALESGVAQYHGTATPGSNRGNIFLFGHSSFYRNVPYKELFKTLNQLQKDDAIEIYSDKKSYTYKVFRSTIIKDDDLSVLADSDTPIVTLMTCWPPGTIDKRYIVQAELQTDGSGQAAPTTQSN